jgi:hypothetical protein
MITKDILVIDGVNGTIESSSVADVFRVTGTAVLTSNWSVAYSGTPVNGETREIRYEAKGITLGGNHISFLGSSMPDEYVAKDLTVFCQYNGTTWDVIMTPDFDESSIINTQHLIDDCITLDKIAADQITNKHIAANAVEEAMINTDAVVTAKIKDNNVTLAKLATQLAYTVLMNNTAGAAVPTAVTLGASTILARLAAGGIVAATPAEIRTLLAVLTTTLASANILVGNAGNVATAVSMTGDISITNAGVTAIGSSKVLESMLGSATASNITKGAVACQYITPAAFKAKLVGADQNLFPVKAGDIILDAIVHTSAAGTVAGKTIDIGYDANVALTGGADDNGLIEAGPSDAVANYSCLNPTYDGLAIRTGTMTVAADGYLTVGVTDGTNLSADGTLIAYCIIYYIPV